MLEHLTAETLKEVYKDIDKARLDAINETTERNIPSQMKKYRDLNNEMEVVAARFEALTGKELWAEIDYTSCGL